MIDLPVDHDEERSSEMIGRERYFFYFSWNVDFKYHFYYFRGSAIGPMALGRPFKRGCRR